MAAADVLGWIGAVLVLGAYALVSLRKLAPSSKLWAAMNIVGSAALAWSAAIDQRWPFVVLNVVWLSIGAWSLIRPPREPGPPTPTPAAPREPPISRQEASD